MVSIVVFTWYLLKKWESNKSTLFSKLLHVALCFFVKRVKQMSVRVVLILARFFSGVICKRCKLGHNNFASNLIQGDMVITSMQKPI